MEPKTKVSKPREDRGRTIRIRNEDWKCLDLVAKQLGMTRHGFILNAIKKALTKALAKAKQS